MGDELTASGRQKVWHMHHLAVRYEHLGSGEWKTRDFAFLHCETFPEWLHEKASKALHLALGSQTILHRIVTYQETEVMLPLAAKQEFLRPPPGPPRTPEFRAFSYEMHVEYRVNNTQTNLRDASLKMCTEIGQQGWKLDIAERILKQFSVNFGEFSIISHSVDREERYVEPGHYFTVNLDPDLPN